MTRKEKLIQALSEEAGNFAARGQSTRDHDLACEYLRTGIKPAQSVIDRHEILDAAVNDLEMLFSDYSVPKEEA